MDDYTTYDCANHFRYYMPGVSKKKYGVADYQYYNNGTTKQYNIFQKIMIKKYNFHLLIM